MFSCPSVRVRKPRPSVLVALGISNVLFMLPWQFAQFVLLTQVRTSVTVTVQRGENLDTERILLYLLITLLLCKVKMILAFANNLYVYMANMAIWLLCRKHNTVLM